MSERIKYQYFLALLLAVLFVVSFYILQGSAGFTLWDEGYLWYGTRRVLEGEVPIRDFMAYDPGRYYWSATIMAFLGDDGLSALRKSIFIFKAIGLFVALSLVTKDKHIKSFYFSFVCLVVFFAWMYPVHKTFDISASICLVAAYAYLLVKPVCKRFFVAGCVVGVVACFGRNHGIYGLIAGIVVFVMLLFRPEMKMAVTRSVLAYATGVVIGYIPVILMLAFVPGFYSAFIDSILFLFEAKATNIALPIPMPWNFDSSASTVEIFRDIIKGLLFTLLPVSIILGYFWLALKIARKEYIDPVIASSIILLLPYTHFAYSRADVSHLAQSIFPLLILILGLASYLDIKKSIIVLGGLLAATLVFMLPFHPGWRCYVERQCVRGNIGADSVMLDAWVAEDIALFKSVYEKYGKGHASYYVAPYWPGAYALYAVRAPVWEVYPLFKRSKDFQAEEIHRINSADVGFVFIDMRKLDGNAAKSYPVTHEYMYQFFIRNYKKVEEKEGSYVIFVKDDSQLI